jgi:hypothetical protein
MNAEGNVYKKSGAIALAPIPQDINTGLSFSFPISYRVQVDTFLQTEPGHH